MPVRLLGRLLLRSLSFLCNFRTEAVAKFFGRSPSTIRTWIRAGRLEAYRFRGSEYRITHAALEEFQDQERNGRQYRT